MMKKRIMILLLSLILVIGGVVGCNNAEKVDADNTSKTDDQTTQSASIISEIPKTTKPKLTEEEKAKKLTNLVQEYIDNGGNATYSIDEFDASVVTTFPNEPSSLKIKGDNGEQIFLTEMISQNTDGTGASFLLATYYSYDGDLIDPNKVYVKNDTDNLLISNFVRMDYDIGLGYVTEMSGKVYNESDYDELLELKKVLKEGKTRMRLSGIGNIDFNLTDDNRKLLIDSIDLFEKFVNNTSNQKEGTK